MTGVSRVSSVSLAQWSGLVGISAIEAEDDDISPECNIVGIGPGLLSACVVAARHGRDCAVLRRTRKQHGTRAQLDGMFDPGRPTALYYADEADRLVADQVGLGVEVWVHVPVATTTLPGPALPAVVAPYSTVADFASAAALLHEGPYVRSSGQVATAYFETLRAAYRYPVAASFAQHAMSHRTWNSAVGVLWGGAYLAVVLALRTGVRAFLADPLAALDPDEQPQAPPGLTAPVAIVDDLINTGTAAAACRRLVGTAGQSADVLALYGLGRPSQLSSMRQNSTIVGAVLSLPG
ncbi:phosphoribosyltransferase [Frankia sp. Cr1]|uniref:phosphoribosyltransferase n=1 Tax=Frankia sp. Cr1 TaxID=3073931 RepID=UPI002AD54EF7|nr:phosphoribosyltransferase [Frankia sp. Cr1]